MFALDLEAKRGSALQVLCLGAHADDVEIGCGGTVLTLLSRYANADFWWVVFSSTPEREREARRSAALFLKSAKRKTVVVKNFRQSYFPYVGAVIKDLFEDLKRQTSPDLILTHYRHDRHQDHRVISDLTWNTFRNHPILEYEIPKYDGDLGAPNCFVPLDSSAYRRKVRYLDAAFGTQRTKHWFSEDTFLGLMRLRGMECCARTGYAEAFYGRKLVIRH